MLKEESFLSSSIYLYLLLQFIYCLLGQRHSRNINAKINNTNNITAPTIIDAKLESITLANAAPINSPIVNKSNNDIIRITISIQRTLFLHPFSQLIQTCGSKIPPPVFDCLHILYYMFGDGFLLII